MTDKYVMVIDRRANQKGRSLGAVFGGEGGRCVKSFLRENCTLAKLELRIGDVVEKVFLKNFLGLFFISNCVVD